MVDSPKKFQCELCKYSSDDRGNLKRHMSDKHDVDVKWFYCDQPGCSRRFKRKGNLESHLVLFHSIGIVWKQCPHCPQRFKQACALNRHMADCHNIGVVWKPCPLCPRRFKQASSLNTHLARVHDVGKYTCDICLKANNSHTPYKDSITNRNLHVCRNCFKKLTGHSTRKEIVWGNYIDKHFGREYLTSSDESLSSLGGCSRYRPDKLYISPELTLLLECDEFAHSGASYSCDERRLTEIHESPSLPPKMVVIRWNPDSYKPRPGQKKALRMDRLKLMVDTMRWVIENHQKWDTLIRVFYLYYSEDSDTMVKNLPSTVIHSMDDLTD